METVVYRTIEYIPLALIGIGLRDFFIIHIFTFAVGHFNHSNFNHAKDLPEDRQTGVNFGLTLSIWDYLFKTNYIPKDGRDIELGFPKDEQFPQDFIGQELHGVVRK